MAALLLLICVVLPTALLIAWFVLVVRRGMPGRWYFGLSATLVVLTVLWGNADAAAEERNLPSACQTGTAGGMQCGFGMAGMIQYANAFFATVLLAILAVVSLHIHRSNREPAE